MSPGASTDTTELRKDSCLRIENMRGGAKKIGNLIPLFLAVLAVVLVVVNIVRRDENSMVARAVAWIGGRTEGFLTCPTGKTAFTDEKGNSFCCGAPLTCSDPSKVCALTRSKDTRDIPTCRT